MWLDGFVMLECGTLKLIIVGIFDFLKVKLNGNSLVYFWKIYKWIVFTIYQSNLSLSSSSFSPNGSRSRQFTATVWAWMMKLFGPILWQSWLELALRELYEGVRETHPRAGNQTTKIRSSNLGFLRLKTEFLSSGLHVVGVSFRGQNLILFVVSSHNRSM